MNLVLACVVEELTRVDGRPQLRVLTIYWFSVAMRRMLWLLQNLVLKTSAHVWNVGRNFEINVALSIIPIELDATIELGFVICGDLISIQERISKVLKVLPAFVLDAKIIHHQTESDWARIMLP